MKKIAAFTFFLIAGEWVAHADSKLSALTPDATAQSTDSFYKVDNNGGSPVSRSITFANLLTAGATYFVGSTALYIASITTNGSMTETFTGVSGATVTLGVNISSVQANIPAANIASGSLGASVIASSLNAVAVPGTYGSATISPTITIGADGRVTSLSSNTISASISTVTAGTNITVSNSTGPTVVVNVSSSPTFTGNVTSNGGSYFGTNVVTGNYTATSTDTVIGSSVSVAGGTISLLSCSGSGQILMIYKADQSTGVVTIQTNGTDVISGTTTLKLNSYTQSDQMMCAQSGLWIPWGQGIQITPANICPITIFSAGQAFAAANDMYVEEITLNVPVTVTGTKYTSVTSAAENVDTGLYNSLGTKIVSNGGTAMGASSTVITSTWTATNVPPGQYYIAIQSSGNVGTYSGFGSGTTAAGAPSGVGLIHPGSFPLPASFAPASAFVAFTSAKVIPVLQLTVKGGGTP